MNPTELTTVVTQGGFALVAIVVLVWQLRWFMGQLTAQISAFTAAMVHLKESVERTHADVRVIRENVEGYRADQPIGDSATIAR